MSQPGLSTFAFDIVTVDAQGQETNRTRGQAQSFTEALSNGVGLEMVAIPGGTFLMGSPSTEADRLEDEEPQHAVTLPPFLISKYPVTQAQWQAVAALPRVSRDLEPDPSHFKGDKRPVEHVSWHNAVEFCARSTKQTRHDYRLPSEAEWEYACRAGTTTPFHFGETLTTLANYDGSSTYASEPKGVYLEQPTEVGTFLPNAFGLYDIHGNVWEWCLDHWHDNYQGAPTDGSAWVTGGDSKYRLLRGGAWNDKPRDCRSAFRVREEPDGWVFGIGFRVVCTSAWTL